MFTTLFGVLMVICFLTFLTFCTRGLHPQRHGLFANGELRCSSSTLLSEQKAPTGRLPAGSFLLANLRWLKSPFTVIVTKVLKSHTKASAVIRLQNQQRMGRVIPIVLCLVR